MMGEARMDRQAHEPAALRQTNHAQQAAHALSAGRREEGRQRVSQCWQHMRRTPGEEPGTNEEQLWMPMRHTRCDAAWREARQETGESER